MTRLRPIALLSGCAITLSSLVAQTVVPAPAVTAAIRREPLAIAEGTELRPGAAPREFLVADARGVVASFTVPAVAGVPGRLAAVAEPGGFVRVQVDWDLAQAVQLDELSIVFDSRLQPDFRWLPHLTVLPTTVVSQQVFRSPAVVLAEGRRQLTLVPALELCEAGNGGPWFLDHDATREEIVLGMCESDVPVHVLFRKQPGMVLGPGVVKLGFRVRVDDDGGRDGQPFGAVSQMLWDRHAEPLRLLGEPRGAPLGSHARQTYDWMANRPGVWHQWRAGGRQVGGVQKLLDLTWSNGWPGQRLPLRFEIWNQAWFSSLRGGSGMLRWARRWDDAGLAERAQRTKNLALSAPQRGGLFPSVYLQDPAGAGRDQVPTASDWAGGRWTGSDRTPVERGIDRDWYHLPDSSTTALWMLRWYRELEPDRALLDYVVRYADALLQYQDGRGFFPTWVDPSTGAPATLLDDSPAASLSATVLLMLVELGVDDGRYEAAALRALQAVCDDPVPAGRWEDFETYWSDNDIGRLTHVGRRFARNGVFKQNTLGMFWTAEACLHAWRVTDDRDWLRFGRRVLDELSMYQQVWQPEFMPQRALGGFGVMNADGEWSDARQSMFAELYLDYYVATGDAELFHRGVAALRAAVTLGWGPLNPELQSVWLARFPFLTPDDHGFANENHGHFGVSGSGGQGLVYFHIFDWGAGAAAEAAARITDRFGDVYLDVARNRVFGINAVAAQLRPDGGIDLTDLGTPSVPGRTVTVVASDGRRWRETLR